MKNLLSNRSVVKHHTIILTEQGECYGWGCNFYGQLGKKINSDNPFPKKCVLFPTIRIDSVKLINCSGHTTMVMTKFNNCYVIGQHNTIYCILSNILSVNCGEDHLAVLTISKDKPTINEIYLWGSNSHGQLGFKEIMIIDMYR